MRGAWHCRHGRYACRRAARPPGCDLRRQRRDRARDRAPVGRDGRARRRDAEECGRDPREGRGLAAPVRPPRLDLGVGERDRAGVLRAWLAHAGQEGRFERRGDAAAPADEEEGEQGEDQEDDTAN